MRAGLGLVAGLAGIVVLGASALAQGGSAVGGPVGAFGGHGDVGVVLHPGETRFDAASKRYTITGSGENMWFGKDEFQFAWQKMSGDVRLAATIRFPDGGGNNHRKAVLMIRGSLETGAAMVDAAAHGDGLTSLQFRDAAGGNTHEVESAETGPKRLELIKRGDRFYLYVSDSTGRMVPSGAAIRVPALGSGEVYVGLGVTAHDKDRSETAEFSDVEIGPAPAMEGPGTLWSTLETVNVASTDRRVAYVAPEHIEAPNWLKDNSALLVNRTDAAGGHIVRLRWEPASLRAVEPAVIPTGAQMRVNNDHGLSPDNRQLAISDGSSADHASRVYVLPIGGGTPRQVTPTGPSYWHGWSPDGKTLAFVGQRGGEFDIYTTPAAAGGTYAETRLTTAKGLDDGPEYTPDGRWIYFCSVRAHGSVPEGQMQVWRMRPDGSGQEQVITDETNDWFPHLSPDGTMMAYLEYKPGVEGHPGGQDVAVRVMDLASKQVRTLATLYGGQGTLNVNSWSPDSKRLSFVSYELLPESGTAGH